ncbi:PGPGW domain-containing protein [Gammaproteobacteria bacterium]|nr:PGPGW domain-containing protein [Gammaproteobacteria bacterium]
MEIYGLNFLYVWLENNSYILFYLGIISVLIFIFSIVGLRLFIIAIPSDYFINKKRVSALRDNSILLWVFYKIFKNIIGYIFIAIGLLALVLPGQGILMILIGLMMSDYPKKFDLEKKIIKINTVRKGVNWIRIKSNVEKIKLN